jgi:beta-galactosidase GanA
MEPNSGLTVAECWARLERLDDAIEQAECNGEWFKLGGLQENRNFFAEKLALCWKREDRELFQQVLEENEAARERCNRPLTPRFWETRIPQVEPINSPSWDRSLGVSK